MEKDLQDDIVTHSGGCHCGAVKWKVRAQQAPTSKYQEKLFILCQLQ